MDINEYLFNKLKDRMLDLFKEVIKREYYAPGGSSSLTIENAVVSDAIKNLGGTIQEEVWVPPDGSVLEEFNDRDGSDAYHYLLSLMDGRRFIIRLTPTALEITDELSKEALEAAFWNIIAMTKNVLEDMSGSSGKYE